MCVQNLTKTKQSNKYSLNQKLRDWESVNTTLKNFVAHLFVTSVPLPPGPLIVPHRNKWSEHLSVVWSQSRENRNFFSIFSHRLIVSNSKWTRWCFPNSLQRFSASDLASLRFNLNLQTPSNAMRLEWSSDKQIVFSFDFEMLWRITHLMLLTVASRS